MSDIILVVFRGREDIVASEAPHMKSPAAIAFPNVVHERNLAGLCSNRSVERLKEHSELWIAIPENSTTPAAHSLTMRPI